jgi:dGTPase
VSARQAAPRRRSDPGTARAADLTATRRKIEAIEEAALAAFAARSAAARRRIPLAAEGRAFDYRTEFQRDRDRIIHARAFRRLQDKTTLPPAGEHDPYRTRQTHALEVSQLGRTLARALRLNEDLVEAIALGHDLGAPPFAEGGVVALAGLAGGLARIPGVAPRVLGAVGGFDLPAQSLRVVDLLEKRYDHPGINLTDVTRAGIWKQVDPLRTKGYPDQPLDGLEPGAPSSAEAQVVRLACRIAAATDTLDALLQSRPALLDRVERLAIVRRLLSRLGRRYPRNGSAFMRLNALHRGLTHLLVTSGILHSEEALDRWSEGEGIDSVDRFRQRRATLPADVISLPTRTAVWLEELEQFLSVEARASRARALADRRARRVLEGLFRAYYADPAVLDDYLLLRFRDAERLRFLRDLSPGEAEADIGRHYQGSPRFVRLILDHLSGMADAYAEAEFRRLSLESGF